MCPSIPSGCSTPRIVISFVSTLSFAVSLMAIVVIAPAAGKNQCASDSGDWLPGYDPFVAAVSVCAAILLKSILGFASIISTTINTLIGARAPLRARLRARRDSPPAAHAHAPARGRSAACAAFAVLHLPGFACLACAGGMLLAFPDESASLFVEYGQCAPLRASQLARACLYASRQPESLGALLLALAALWLCSFAEASRVIGFLAFIYRFMLALNCASAAAGLAVFAAGGWLYSEAQRATGGEAAQAQLAQLVPEWAPPLLVLAGLVMLVMSLLACVGLMKRMERLLYVHVFCSLAIWLTLAIGALRCARALPAAAARCAQPQGARARGRSSRRPLFAPRAHARRAHRQRMHVRELGSLASAHKLSVACTVVLVLLLLVLNVAGSVHMLVEIRRQGVTFSELVDSADYTVGRKLRDNLGAPLPLLRPMRRAVRPAAHGSAEPAPFSLELEEQRGEHFHATVNAKAFFGAR